MEVFLQQLINGIGLGAVYALIAVGYTMVYGILGLINFAHGDVFMLAPAVVISLYLPALLFALPVNWMAAAAALAAAVVACGLMGFLIERIAYRPLRQPYALSTCGIVAFVLPALLFGGSLLVPEKLDIRSGDPAKLGNALRTL